MTFVVRSLLPGGSDAGDIDSEQDVAFIWCSCLQMLCHPLQCTYSIYLPAVALVSAPRPPCRIDSAFIPGERSSAST